MAQSLTHEPRSLKNFIERRSWMLVAAQRIAVHSSSSEVEIGLRTVIEPVLPTPLHLRCWRCFAPSPSSRRAGPKLLSALAE